MNKTIKYSLVAGLTMAAFSLGTVPATYATEATAYVWKVKVLLLQRQVP